MEPNIEVKSNKTSTSKIPRNVELKIVNFLGITLDCQIELVGNNLTIWVSEKK